MSKRAISWNSPAVVFAVVFCLVLSTATFVTRVLYANGGKADAPPPAKVVANWRELAAAGQASGSVVAPVNVVVFADYQCPGCAELHRLLRVAGDSMPRELRIVTRHFPLSGHPFAKAAANAAECAAEQGRFREFESVAYAQQDSIGTKPWLRFATDAGVRDTADFSQCVSKGRFAPIVNRDLKVSRALGLVGTPVYIINGTSRFGAPPLGELLQQLREAAQSATDSIAAPTGAATSTRAVPNRSLPVARRWLQPLELERTITGPDRDELLMPGSLSALKGSQLVLFDFGSMELRAFDREGTPLWRTGRKGAGPGEFRNAMDVEVRSNGEIAVLDMENRRITSVSETGRVLRSFPLTLSSNRLVPLPDTTRYLLAGEDSSTLWKAVNSRGDSVAVAVAPAALVARQGIERETFSAPLASGAVIAYRWSDKLALLGPDSSVRHVVNGIEPVLFPGTKSYPLKFARFKGHVSRISPAAIPGALSVTALGPSIFVLFAGATPNRGRIVDVYDSDTGAYQGSHLLPFAALELVALAKGAFATLRSEPLPSLDILTVQAAVRP